mgnify:CR=1 FL=1
MSKYLPDIYRKNIFDIDYNKLKKKGIKCLIFDLDNTLALIDSVKVDVKVKELIAKLKKDFLVVIVSNSPKKRVLKFSSDLEVDSYPFALKPTIRTLKKIKSKYNLESKSIAIIGDQFITDMGYGYKGKITKIFVDPLATKDLKITNVNRYLEEKIMKKYSKNNLFKKGNYYE